MEQFLQQEALVGNLKHAETGEVVYPINNQTNWAGQPKLDKLKQYLQSISYTPMNWKPGECLAAFPNGTLPGYFDTMRYYLRNVTNNKRGPYPRPYDYTDNNRVQVDGSPIERMREAITGGVGGAIRSLCLYDKHAQEQNVIHFPCNRQMRLLTHHYHFLYYLVRREKGFYIIYCFVMSHAKPSHHCFSNNTSCLMYRVGNMTYGPKDL